jgi:hypothetical protein
MWFWWKIINSSRSHSKNWTHKIIVWYLQPDLGSGQKHVQRPITEKTIAGSEDMTLPSVAIAFPFYFTHFSSIKSIAFRCLCIKCMQSEKLNKEIAKWTRFLYIGLFWKIINFSRSHSNNWTHKIIVWYLQSGFGYWIKACLKAHNRESNCKEWGYDIAIYDNIVESLVWSRCGNSTPFLLYPFLLKRFRCFQMPLPKPHAKGLFKSRHCKHHLKWKWLL